MCVYEFLTNLSVQGCATTTVAAMSEMLYSVLRIPPSPALCNSPQCTRKQGPQQLEGKGCFRGSVEGIICIIG